MARVIVIGGGIAGLSAAWELERHGHEVVLAEIRRRLGGNIHTYTEGPYRYEAGPHSFLGAGESLLRLVRELGIEDRLQPADPSAARRYILKDGILRPLPTSGLSFLTSRILSWRAKFYLMCEPFRTMRHPPEASVDVWMRAHLGPEVAEYLVAAFVSGIYAGDTTQLAIGAAFPKFHGFETAAGSMIRGAVRHLRALKDQTAANPEAHPRRKGLWSFDGGMGTLVEALETRLRARVLRETSPERLQPAGWGWKVDLGRGSEEFDGAVIATRAFEAAAWIAPLNGELSGRMRDLEYAPVCVLHAAVDRANLRRPLDGFGFLIPPNQNRPLLGCIWVSSIFPNRCPDDQALLSVFVGGATGARHIRPDDAVMQSMVLDELTRTILIEPRARWSRLMRHPAAIPQYTRAQLLLKAGALRLMGDHPTLVLAGNYLGGVSAADTVAWARDRAAALAASLG